MGIRAAMFCTGWLALDLMWVAHTVSSSPNFGLLCVVFLGVKVVRLDMGFEPTDSHKDRLCFQYLIYPNVCLESLEICYEPEKQQSLLRLAVLSLLLGSPVQFNAGRQCLKDL
jgi:hypothetical protein